MFGYLKQSTAAQSRMVGPFVDDIDFKTSETGLTIANTDVKLSKNGAAGVNKNSGGGTHRNNGMYSLTFDATDSGTVGELEGSISVSGALIVVFKFVVLEEAVYDALFAASAPGYLQPTVAGRAISVESDGDLTKVNLLDGNTPQGGDNFARIGVSGAGLSNINLPNQTMNITGNISGSVGSVTGNLGGNVAGSVNNVTSAVTVGTLNANVITAASIATSALNNKGNWNIGKTGYTLTQSFPANFASLGIEGDGDITKVNLVAVTAINSDMRGNDGANTVVPDNAGIAANGVKLDTLVTGVNIQKINGVTITGDGSGTPFDV